MDRFIQVLERHNSIFLVALLSVPQPLMLAMSNEINPVLAETPDRFVPFVARSGGLLVLLSLVGYSLAVKRMGSEAVEPIGRHMKVVLFLILGMLPSLIVVPYYVLVKREV